MKRKNTMVMAAWYASSGITAALILTACAVTENVALKTANQSYATAAADPAVTGNPPSADYLAQADLNLHQASRLDYDMKWLSPLGRRIQLDPRELDDLTTVAATQVTLARISAQQAQAKRKLAELDTANLTTLQAQETQADDEMARLRAELDRKGNDRIAALDAKLNASLDAARKRGAKITRDGDKIDITLNNVTFDFDKATIKDEFVPVLTQIANGLSNRYPNATLKIFGYTDNVGTEQYNQQLSDERAQAVKELLSQLGMDGKRITTRGMGATAPLASNDTPAGRERNRRVELVIQGRPE